MASSWIALRPLRTRSQGAADEENDDKSPSELTADNEQGQANAARSMFAPVGLWFGNVRQTVDRSAGKLTSMTGPKGPLENECEFEIEPRSQNKVLTVGKSLATGMAGLAAAVRSKVEKEISVLGSGAQQPTSQEPRLPPWGTDDAEGLLKSHIMALSCDKRNFLMDPPPGTNFVFDMSEYVGTALCAMEEDQRLRSIRFDLVPKLVSENNFWRNYFYRVSLIRQQLLAASTDSQDGDIADAHDKGKEDTQDEHRIERECIQKHSSPSHAGTMITTAENADPLTGQPIIGQRPSLKLEEGTVDDSALDALEAELAGLDMAAVDGELEGFSD